MAPHSLLVFLRSRQWLCHGSAGAQALRPLAQLELCGEIVMTLGRGSSDSESATIHHSNSERSFMPLSDIQELFRAGCMTHTAMNFWRECAHIRCIMQHRCIGGPRGTCRATGGFPACSEEGKRRLEMYKNRRRWKNETGYEAESPVDRQTRLMEHQLKRIELRNLAQELSHNAAGFKNQRT